MREGEREEKTAEEVTILSYLLFPRKYPKARVRESAFEFSKYSFFQTAQYEIISYYSFQGPYRLKNISLISNQIHTY